jgi:hypothetical protein
MLMDNISLLGSITGLGLMAGLRLYATVLIAGLGIRFNLIHLDPSLSHLVVLSNPIILVTAGIAYLMEFFADKVPWVDSLWDSVHTFIRPLGAALLGFTAVGNVNPVVKMLAFILCGGAAIASHSTKAGTRLFANHSPEPISNIALSLGEDVLAFVGTWFSLKHPRVMLVAVVIFIALFLWLAPLFFRQMRVELNALRGLIAKFTSESTVSSLREKVPEYYENYIWKRCDPARLEFAMRCVASKGVNGLRNSIGYLCSDREKLFFVTRRCFRLRTYETKSEAVSNLEFRKGLFLGSLSFRDEKGRRSFYFFKNGFREAEKIVASLSHPLEGKAC